MSTKLKSIILVLILLFCGIVYIDYTKPKPINWEQTYNLQDKIPFGLYVFDHESKVLFKQNKIKKINKTIYEFLEPQYNYDSLVNRYKCQGTLFYIGKNYNIDDESTQEMLYFVSKGNAAFISADEFSTKLLDSLHLKILPQFSISDKNQVWLTNSKFKNQKTNLDLGVSATVFTKLDTVSTIVLGYQGDEKRKEINYIKVPYYDGFFYLHTQPASFSNYHLLKNNNYNYSQNVLSYLPPGDLFWIAKSQNGNAISNSPLRFIFSQPALKWAWYVLIFGLLLFIIFNAKRKQRIVPIINKLNNSTVDFTKTIGNLYYQEANHQNIIDKKIIYFLEKIRSEFLLDTTILDDKFVLRYQLKSGKNSNDIKNAVRLINYHRRHLHESIESDVVELNTAIEKIT